MNLIGFDSMLMIFIISLFTRIPEIVLAEEQCCLEDENTLSNDTFPKYFIFGTSTSSYQIEGGWRAKGKGPSIWDTFTHQHSDLIADGSNADIGANSYQFYADDVRMISETKMNFYRFSVSWSRILPDGDISSLNMDGIRYYNNLINMLLKNKIQPIITIYHFDLPQMLQNYGGFLNPKFIDYYEQFANLLFKYYGDRVKRWVTFNEPYMFCIHGYGASREAPLIWAPGVGEYYCIDHVLKAHATVYHLYKQKYFKKQGGKVGITFDSLYYYPKTEYDVDAVERAMQFTLGWLAHPIFSTEGDYPKIMRKVIDQNSKNEGRAWSRLPVMTEEWRIKIKGAADFMGLNYYTSRLVQIGDPDPIPRGVPSWTRDSNLSYSVDPRWKRSDRMNMYSVPQGCGDILKWIKKHYHNPEVIITENGWPDDEDYNDKGRVSFMADHLSQVIKSINVYGCNIKGYATWSLMDNFEWLNGYTVKFGIYNVNMDSPTKERKAKRSARFYKRVIETRRVPDIESVQ